MNGHEVAPPGLQQRLFLVGLFTVFMVPIFGALLLNILAPSWMPFGQVNRGQLVDPPLRIDGSLLDYTGRREVTRSDESGTWMVVHVGEPPCDTTCERALVSLRQARLALGKDASRVERWWMMTRDADARSVQRVASAHPGLRIMALDRPWPLSQGTAPIQVIDPAGYVILRYESPDAASDLLKDLKRLLKISKQG